MSALVPETYTEWRHCIEVECRLELTPRFIAERLEALQNPKDHHTERFVKLWGRAHHARVLEWFRQAQSELATGREGAG